MIKDIKAVLIKAEAAYAALVAAAHAPQISASVKAQLIKAAALTGHFIDYLTFNDAATFSETLAFDVAKPLDDLFKVADVAAITAGKTFNDGFSVSDVQIASVTKGLAEVLGLVDVKVFAMAKPLRDDPVAYDQAAVKVSRPVGVDHVIWREGPGIDDYALDYFAADYGYDGKPTLLLSKPKSDAAAITDSSISLVNKGLTETPRFTDALTRRLSRTISDSINATDDFMGVANLDDDEVMTLVKPFSEAVGVGDTFVKVVYFVRQFGENLSFTDTPRFNTSKALSESPRLVDVSTISLARPLSDSGAATDSVAKQPQLGKSDSASMTDSGVLQMNGYCDLSYFATDYVGAYLTF